MFSSGFFPPKPIYRINHAPLIAFIALFSAFLLAQKSGPPLSTGPLMFLPAVEYESGGVQGNAVTIADLNGDGKPDLVITNSTSSTVGVLLGNGDGTFQAVKTYESTFDPSQVVVADVNGDGKPDLLVANICNASCTTGSISVFLGNGDGTFKAAVTFSTHGYSTTSVAVADVNGDGQLDLLATNWCPDSICNADGSVAVLLGNGDGTFKAAVKYDAGAPYASSLAVADVNGDAKPDVVVANWCPSVSRCTLNKEVAVLLNKGDGTFEPPVTYASGGFVANSISVADVNDDGHPDLLVSNGCASTACTEAATSVGVLLGNGDGTFRSPVSYPAAVRYAGGLSVADVNGDGKPDLIVAGCGGGANCANGASLVSVLLGRGDGTFQPGLNYFVAKTEIGAPAVGDLNGDGKLDIVLATDCTASGCSSGESSATVVLNNIGAALTTTSVTASANPVTFRQTVTYTAKVTSQAGGALSGTIVFADGDTPVATVALSSSEATYSTFYTGFGSHPITASYSGKLHTNEGSRSSALAENVFFPTRTTLTTSGSPTFVGQPVTFTATLYTYNYGSIPDGELVRFYDGNTLLASVPLAGEKASFTTSGLSGKHHGMKAVYVGDTKFISSSGFVTQVVELYSTTTSLRTTPNPSQSGQAVTITATVKSFGPDTPTGKAVFYDGTTWIGAANLSGGAGTITKSNLSVGTHSITAKYSGDSRSASSTSSALNQVVQ